MLKFLFFTSYLIIFYSYIGYGILIYILVKFKQIFFKNRRFNPDLEFEPEVTLLVAAYNEAEVIEQKIQNSISLDYPSEKLRLIFITDGSTDASRAIIGRYKNILQLHEKERKGKLAAINRAIKYVETPFVIFSDANTQLNEGCIREIVKHYQDTKVGGVAGEKKIILKEKDKAVASGENIYWKYESILKKLDSEFYSVVGAAGELFSIRTSLYRETPKDTIIEDFVLSLQISMAGNPIRYEPSAFATETSSLSISEEQKRKVRIAAGAFQAMRILKDLFNVFRYPILSFQFISHRVLRWTLCPICLITGFLSNVLIVLNGSAYFYIVVLLAQCVFYVMAFFGWLLANRDLKIKSFYVPYYFLFMNLSVFLGFYRFLLKKQTSIWEKATRHSNP
jgi:biofilm PGA synthesis N-glycosyltransferase PgaC